MPTALVVIASTRPGRVGLPVAEWFVERARAHGAFELDVVDLADLDLPMMDEPNHPRLRRYTHDHTKAWSARVDAADAFVLVTPEYNAGFTAPLKNALDYLHEEWRWKPAGIVSYGGVSAGLRAANMLRPVLATLRMTPLTAAVSIPFVKQLLDDDGRIEPNETMQEAADLMLEEMALVERTLRPLREGAAQAA